MVDPALVERITKDLSVPQKKVVLSAAPYLRILAGAGAGKTETMTRRIVYLLASGAAPSSIVAFTFTERAAAQVKERIYLRTEELLSPDFCRDLGDMSIGTIHAFALELLQEQFGFGGYNVLDENQEMAFLMREGWGLGLGPGAKLAFTQSLAQNCQTFLSSAGVVYDELIDRATLWSRNPDFATELNKYETLLAQHRLLTFGQIIERAVAQLLSDRSAAEKIQHLIVDEYQDINHGQETLIFLIAESASCYVVGDPRQCIYQWRGSDSSCFERFAEEHSADTVELAENRRSTGSIVSAGNAIARSLHDPLLHSEMEKVRGRDGTVILVEHSFAADEATWIGSQIRTLVEEGVCRYQDIAVLLRSVTTSAPPILASLRDSQVPYLVGGKVGLFSRDEAQAVGALFNWCAGMDWQVDSWGQRRVLPRDIPRFIHDHWPTSIDVSRLEQFRSQLMGGEHDHFTAAYQDLLVSLGVLDWDPEEPEAAARLANLGRFNALLTDFEAARRLGGRRQDWERDCKDLAWFIRSFALSAYEEQPAEDLRSVDAISVMTVHQAKGLEWPLVFVPSLTDGRFPSRRAGQGRSWLLSTSLFDEVRYRGSMDDERKLFYVAVTRARDALCLSYPERINTNRASRSPFIDGLGLYPIAPTDDPFVHDVEFTQLPEDDIMALTATEVIEYLRCPHFYRMRNLWGYQGGIVAELGYGKAIHHVLRVLAERSQRGADPEALLASVVEEHFHLPYAPPGMKRTMAHAAQRMIGQYLADHRADLDNVEEIEARLEYKLGQIARTIATVRGRVDIITSPDGERILRDYKTAQDPEEGDSDDPRIVEESALQLTIYAAGEIELRRPVAGASVAFLRSGELRDVPVEPIHLDQAKNRALGAVEGILNKDFVGRPCGFCNECDYRRICRWS